MQANTLLLVSLLAVVGYNNGCFIVPYNRASGINSEQTDDPQVQQNNGTYGEFDENGTLIGDYYQQGIYDQENQTLNLLSNNSDAGSMGENIYGSQIFGPSANPLSGGENADTKTNLKRKQWLYAVNRGIRSIVPPAVSTGGPNLYLNQSADDGVGFDLGTNSTETEQGNSEGNSSYTKKNLVFSFDAMVNPLVLSNYRRRGLNDIIPSLKAHRKREDLYWDCSGKSAPQGTVNTADSYDSDDAGENAPRPKKMQKKKRVFKSQNNMIRQLAEPQNSFTMSTFPK